MSNTPTPPLSDERLEEIREQLSLENGMDLTCDGWVKSARALFAQVAHQNRVIERVRAVAEKGFIRNDRKKWVSRTQCEQGESYMAESILEALEPKP